VHSTFTEFSEYAATSFSVCNFIFSRAQHTDRHSKVRAIDYTPIGIIDSVETSFLHLKHPAAQMTTCGEALSFHFKGSLRAWELAKETFDTPRNDAPAGWGT